MKLWYLWFLLDAKCGFTFIIQVRFFVLPIPQYKTTFSTDSENVSSPPHSIGIGGWLCLMQQLLLDLLSSTDNNTREFLICRSNLTCCWPGIHSATSSPNYRENFFNAVLVEFGGTYNVIAFVKDRMLSIVADSPQWVAMFVWLLLASFESMRFVLPCVAYCPQALSRHTILACPRIIS